MARFQKHHPNKYNNTKISINGQKFDSMKEFNRYNELLLLERAGAIQDLQRQVPFVLIPSQYVAIDGKTKLVERECKYIADFVYTENGETVVEDTKGVKTDVYKIKKKLMLYTHGIQVKET